MDLEVLKVYFKLIFRIGNQYANHAHSDLLEFIGEVWFNWYYIIISLNFEIFL